MFARQITLGRVVIVLGGLAVFAALTSQIFASSDKPWFWTGTIFGIFVGMIGGFIALILIGRYVGGWVAGRLGSDAEAGRKTGAGLAVGLPALVYTLCRWFGLI